MDSALLSGLSSMSGPRKRALSVRAPRALNLETADNMSPMVVEPVSPSGRLMDSLYIIVTMGIGVQVDLPAFRAGIEAQLARHPRFRSIQVTDGFDDGNPRWVQSTVNLDDHIVIPNLDPAAVVADPDQAVEDYVASLSLLAMDRSRPMWEFHILNFPTSEAASTIAICAHHSLGDGMALISLLVACTRSAADPTRLPTMPLPARSGPIYTKPRPPASAGARASVLWLWSFAVLAWHTVLDVIAFLVTVLFVSDPHTMFKSQADKGGVLHRKRFVHRTLSLEDVKLVKNAMKSTVNDVLVGVTSAALSQYYFRNSGDTDTTKLLRLRSILVVNIRPPTGLHAIVEMIESGNSKNVKWGNRLGYIILPFHIATQKDPLDYIRIAKNTIDRKKSSLEAIFTHAIGEIALKLFGIKAAAFIFGRMLSNTTTAFSNLVGPGEQVELFGHPVTFIAPSAIVPPEALTIHYQSYNNAVKVILAVDEAQFDHRQLLDDFTGSLRRIKDAAAATKL